MARIRAIGSGVFVGLIADGAVRAVGADRPSLDFGLFLASGRAILTGTDPYATFPLIARSGQVINHGVNLDPPALLPLFSVLARLPAETASAVWFVVSLLSFALAVSLLTRAYPEQVTPLRLLVSCALAGLWNALELGQIYTVLFLLVVLAWLTLRDNQSVRAGLALGILFAIKPNLLLWPGLLFVSGQRKTALVAFASWFACTFGAVVVYGPSVTLGWVYDFLWTAKGVGVAGNASLPAFFARLGLPSLGILLSLACLVMLAYEVHRRRPSPLDTSAVALLAALLLAPLAWVGYTILLLPLVWSRSWSVALAIGVALLCVPSWLVYSIGGLVVGSVYFVSLIAVAYGLGAAPESRGAAREEVARSGEDLDRRDRRRVAPAPAIGDRKQPA